MFKNKRQEIYDRIKDNWNPPHVVVFNDDFSIREIYDKSAPVKVCKTSDGNYLSAYGMDIYNVKCTTIYTNSPGFEDLAEKYAPKIEPKVETTSKFSFGFNKK